jgi:hypothetical protein
MAASTDYTGRTVDQLIFQGVEPAGDQLLDLGWGDAGEMCTGVQKVAQTWTILFMTDLGSIPLDLTRGSDFLQAVRSGRIQVDEDVEAEFNLAAARVRRTMDQDAADVDDLPDDERLDEAVLVDVDIDQAMSRLYLRVNIRTIAGDSRTIFLPVPVSIR